MSDLNSLKSDLATAIRLLTAEGLMDFNGHLSVRIPDDPNRILINPRAISRTAVTSGDIVTIDLRGNLIDGKLEPPSETPIHTAIYRQRAEVVSVAHIHPAIATAFSIAGVRIDPVFTLGCLFQGGVPVYDKPDLVRTDAQGDELAESLGASRAALMRAHGAVVVGESIEACFNACIWLEENAKKQLAARQLGNTIRILSDAEIARLKRDLWRPEVIRKTWDYYVAKGRANGVL
ncbi:MAG: class II aldolase/adducin family protein [Chloroflexota bacterium]|nr:class II aldolase/adducin family protein [Chloroflexota bacterium]